MLSENLFVISAPSGAGKTTIIKKLTKIRKDIFIPTSYTTRNPRPGEIDKKDYNFTSHEIFHEMIRDDALVEHAEVYGNFYGTSYEAIINGLNNEPKVLLEIDCQGAKIIKRRFESAKLIFIMPPSLNELNQRITHRGQDSSQSIEIRLSQAKSEMAQWKDFDYALINQDSDQCLEELLSIIDDLNQDHATSKPSVVAKMEDAIKTKLY
jgi:guanylate kinase